MFGRRVVDDKVHYDFYAPFLASFQHRLEVVKGAVFGRDVAIIGNVISEVALRTFVNGRKPDGVNTQPFQIINLKAENDFRLTREELVEAITPNTKVLILPFPNNPTGAIMEKKDLEAIAEVIIEKDIFVISDEIYSELTYGREHVTVASIPGMKERTILINGFSKAFAMTGWRLGYACGPRNIMEQMIKIHQFAIMCAPTNSQYAGIDALKNSDDDVALMRETYDGRRRFLMNSFKELGLDCFEPFGAFYVFPCIKEFNMTSEEFATRLLEEEKVAVVPGTAFGDCGEGFLRISYAYSLEDLKLAMGHIKNFIERLRANK